MDSKGSECKLNVLQMDIERSKCKVQFLLNGYWIIGMFGIISSPLVLKDRNVR